MAAKQWSPERRAKFEATIAAKKAGKKRSKKKTRRTPKPNGRAEPKPMPPGGFEDIDLMVDTVGRLVRAIVREEIRRLLS